MDNNNQQQGNAQQQQHWAKLRVHEDGIDVPNPLVESLAWMRRSEMANSSLSTASRTFQQLCWPKLHGNVEPRRIEQLYFCLKWDNNNSSAVRLGGSWDPVPTNVPPPPYILGFQRIDIHFLDEQLLEFVQIILPRLNRIELLLDFPCCWMRVKDNNMIKLYGRLLDLLANKIFRFNFEKNDLYQFYTYERVEQILEFIQLFPGFFQKMHHLCASTQPMPAEIDIIFDWLALPPPTNAAAGVRQKIVQFGHRSTGLQFEEYGTDEFVDRIKQEFSNAIAPRNFFIVGPFDAIPLAHFTMENVKTGEILILTGGPSRIVRCPKGEENFWNGEGLRKTEEAWWDSNEQTLTKIKL